MKLWNLDTRRGLVVVKPGEDAMKITFSPDGQTLAAWNPWDGVGLLRLWRAPVTEMKRLKPLDSWRILRPPFGAFTPAEEPLHARSNVQVQSTVQSARLQAIIRPRGQDGFTCFVTSPRLRCRNR
jgi:WD40 repeat protein